MTNFRYPVTRSGRKKPEKKVDELNYLPDEELTGFIRGQPAESKDEERIAIGLGKLRLGFSYQVPIDTKFTLPDGAKKVDFVVYKALRVHPLEFYGDFWHSTSGDKFRDTERERQLNEVFLSRGWEKLKIIWSHEAYDQMTVDGRLKVLFT